MQRTDPFYEGGRIIGVAVLAGAISLLALISVIALPCGAFAAQKTGTSAASVAGDAATSPKIHELVSLLADPEIQEWLKQEDKKKSAAEPKDDADSSVSHYFVSRLRAVREHIAALAGGLPDLPGQFDRGVGLLQAEIPRRGTVVLLVLVFAGLGYGVQWLFRKATQQVRRRLDVLPMETVNGRLRLVAARFAFALGVVVAFALGSIGPFLALDWPPLLNEMVFGYLGALLVTRIAVVVAQFLLSPDAERFRIVPMDAAAARFWCRRLAAFVGWFAFGWVTVGLLSTFGFSLEGRQLVAYTLGLGLLAIALECVWRRPVASDRGIDAPPSKRLRLGRGAQNAMLSIAIVLLWAFWVARAMPGFWLIVVIIALPLAISITQRAVEHLLRPPGSAETTEGPPSVIAVCLERGIRALLIIAAAAVLGWGWGIDLVRIAGQDTWFAQVVHSALSAVVILLAADVLWQTMKTAIDRKLGETAELGPPNTEEARRRARLHTLLPIFRNILFFLVIAVAAMMALAEMGVQIGPLIAGAGVLGVAVGFGAQTFVRDVIAGMFYLLDDAFRVGEYIVAGRYKGTVESFSIRSVRLRHHRGPVFTVPFNLLGAVENMSRDWVIDKMTVGVTYDSDLEKARKLIKQIGLELKQDPEFAPLILEPLKMQGVEQFGDFAIQIRMKMMTLPGEQFVIRRKAYAMIKKAFDANGIKFAFPTVQVAGEGEAITAAVAQRALELTQPAAAAE
jgi:small-conductance mechanosensitive channel